MHLPKLSDINVQGKKVLVRVDMDVPFEKEVNSQGVPNYQIQDFSRINAWKKTVDYLLKEGAEQVILIGHIGRPLKEGNEKISTFAIKIPDMPLNWWPDNLKGEGGPLVQHEDDPKVHLLENLRFYEGEEANDPEFAKKLASFGDIYVNDAFASSHREHASIVGVPKLLPHAMGLNFEKEVENLTKIIDNPQRPLVSLLSGIKEDKLKYISGFKNFSDKVLIAGRLPEYIDPDYGKGQGMPELLKDDKVMVGRLIQDREDITIHTAEQFEEEIKKAKSIVLAGVMGKYEEEGHRQGTTRVFQAVANSPAFKIAGGGDTLRALEMLGLKEKFDWISVGGGATVEFLINHTLPGIEALK